MAVLTSFALLFGIIVGGLGGYYIAKRRMKKKIAKAIKEGTYQKMHTLKSEGDDQPNKETELLHEGKAVVLQQQPAVSPNIQPAPIPIEKVIEPITQIQAEVEALPVKQVSEEVIDPEVEKIRKEAEEQIKQLEIDRLKVVKDNEIKKIKKAEADMIKKIKLETAKQIKEKE